MRGKFEKLKEGLSLITTATQLSSNLKESMLRRALTETLEIVKELETGIADLYRLTYLASLE